MNGTGTKEIKGISVGFFKAREFGVLIGLALLVLVFSILSDRFFTTENIMNIIRQVSIIGIISMGMTMVIVSGEIDLSVGAIYGMSAMVAGSFMISGTSVILSCIFGLLAGVVAGATNGVLVSVVRVPSLIATLGILNIARGTALIVTGGGVVNLMSTRFVADPNLEYFIKLGQGKVFNVIPNLALIFVIIALISYFIFHKTLLGFNMKAIGGNENSARVSGINVKLVKITAFVILGLFCAFGGLLNFAFLSAVQGTMGQGLELDVIAATIIGGASLSGGEATIPGTIIGVLLMGVLKNGLVLLGVTPFLQMIFIGVVIIVAVTIDVWTRK